MPDTIKVPGIGPLNKKYAYVGAAGIAGFVGYAYWRNRQAQATDTTATDTTATDTTALDAANAAASDSSYAYDYSGYSDGGYAYGGGAPIYSSPGGSNFPTPTGGAPTTDHDWNQAAYEALTDRGVESTAASHALSRYQADLCLTGTEADYVRQAIAAVGDTPQTHHNIQICPGDNNGQPPAAVPTAPGGFHVTSTSTTKVCLAWTPMIGVLGYHIKIKGPGFDHTVVTHNNGTYCVGNLHRKSTYSFYVSAYNSAGTGAPSATASAHTK